MKAHICYIKPQAPIHLQKGGGDHETVDLYPRSDTLSAALSYWWFRQYKELPGFPEQMPFRLSSLFLAVDNDEKIIRLYPKPSGIKIDPRKHDHKVFKKISWLGEDLFEYWRNGKNMRKYIPVDSDDNRLKRNGDVLVKDEQTKLGTGPLLKTDARTRATLDRVSSASNLFHFVQVAYAADVYLWFYADIKSFIKKKLIGLLRLLGDEGIGGDRTVGMGHFRLHDIIETEGHNTKADKLYNLGIFNPAPDEVNQIVWNYSTYQLETRTGWVSGHALRRSPVPCITENAVLKTHLNLKGHVPCVLVKNSNQLPENKRPAYSVYRDCQGYFIPCQ